MSKGELLFKQKSFRRFRESYQEEKIDREINMKSKRFAFQLGFKTFKRKFIEYIKIFYQS